MTFFGKLRLLCNGVGKAGLAVGANLLSVLGSKDIRCDHQLVKIICFGLIVEPGSAFVVIVGGF